MAEGVSAGLSKEQANSLARSIANEYKQGRAKKRMRDLTAEKYMLHTHGEGDAQWLDIVNGSRIAPAPNLDGSIRAQSNLLRPILGNAVNHHVAIPFRVISEAGQSRTARDRSKIDTIWANDLLTRQRLNELVGDGLHVAGVYGNFPLFAAWREDVRSDQFEPIYDAMGQVIGESRPGFLDCWVGDPWGHIYNTGAKRRSVHWSIYERIVPVRLVKQAFGGELERQGATVKGRTDMPSSSRYQMIANKWKLAGAGVHGTAALSSGEGGEELVALLCKETAPGFDDEYPDGRLTIVVLSGVGDAENTIGQPILVHDGPLPGKRFSFVRFYLLDGFDDVHGKAFVSDLDDRQVLRNNLETLLLNGSLRAGHPMAYMGPGAGDDDTAAFVPDGIIEVASGITPGYFQYPTQWMNAVEAQIQRVEADMFRIGAWQAASRGESHSGDAAAKTVALARADDTILGPANRGVQGSLCEFLSLCHALTKEHAGNFPIPVRVAGQDYAHLKKSYLRADELSDEPRFTVVSGSATPEARAQQLLNLNATKGADGQPVLTTAQLKKQYPDASIWPNDTDIAEVKERRAQAINYAIRDAVAEFRQQTGFDEAQQPEQWQEQAVMYAAQQVFMSLPKDAREIARDDDPQLHINTLSELTQDMSEDPLVREVASMKQDLLWQWMDQIAAQNAPPPGNGQPANAGGQQPTQAARSQFGGTSTSDQMANTGSEVASLTRQAAQGAA